MKLCRGCGREKPPDAFYKDRRTDSRRSKDGLLYRCIECLKDQARKRYATQEYRDWSRERQRKKRAENPEHEREMLRRWRAAHPEKYKATVSKNNRDYYRQHAAEMCERKRKWRKENPDLHCANAAKRRARMLDGISRGLSRQEWRDICALYEHRCAYCRSEAKLTRDHVHPISRGGRDEPGNVVPACMRCNVSKKNRLISQWKPEWKPR